jgi:hypothetical protein
VDSHAASDRKEMQAFGRYGIQTGAEPEHLRAAAPRRGPSGFAPAPHSTAGLTEAQDVAPLQGAVLEIPGEVVELRRQAAEGDAARTL